MVLEARELSSVLLGQDQYANMLLAGAAYQAGALPIPGRYVEEAIRRAGVQVEKNIEAFRRGRQAVAAPDDLAAAVADTLLAGLTPDTHGAAVEIASLPDMIRGYEEIKVGSARRYREELGQRFSAW